MVPKMIAGMMTYEAERLTVGKLYNSETEKAGKGYFTEDVKRNFLRPRLIEERAQSLTLASKSLAEKSKKAFLQNLMIKYLMC